MPSLPTLQFQPLGSQTIEGRFDGDRVSSDAGALLLREVDRVIGLTHRMAATFIDSRDPTHVAYETVSLVRQRIFALACGYEDLNDHDTLRHDPAMALFAGVAPGTPLAGKSTLNRLEQGAASDTGPTRYQRIAPDQIALDKLLVTLFLESHRRAPKEIVLDLDATHDLIHGMQEGRHFNAFYGGYCYLPLYIFAGEHLLCARLRASDAGAADGAIAEVDRIVRRIRAKWPKTRILLRADSGFSRDDLMTWCETNQVGYVFGLARTTRLIAKLQTAMTAAVRQGRATGAAARVFTQFSHRTRDSWSAERRVVGKAEYLPGEGEKENPRFLVTNLPPSRHSPRALYERVYCARGEMENRIKEQKMLASDRTSTATMRSNQLRVTFSAMAYTLLYALRRLGLRQTVLARAQCETLRLKLLKIAARIRWSSRRVVVAFAAHHPMVDAFIRAHAALVALPDYG